MVSSEISGGGGQGAGARDIMGLEGYGRREKKGREAGENSKRQACVTAYHQVKETYPATFFDFHLTSSEA